MKVFNLAEIKNAFNFEEAVAAIKQAFIAFSNGNVNTPPVGYIGFQNPPGDMHIKYGHIKGDDVFVVKLATGFYENPKKGLPSSNGMMLVISAQTGEPLALLQDEGFLTDMRTAIAGCIVSDIMSHDGPLSVGIIGTGIQAQQQLEYLSKIRQIKEAFVWGRSTRNIAQYLDAMAEKDIKVTALNSVEDICSRARTIITTTPATSPLIKTNWIKAGTHITAVGADAPGKRELADGIFDQCSMTICDSKEQCMHHGEISYAPNGTLNANNCMELGKLLESPSAFQRKKMDITVCDLTGIAAQDIAIAKSIWGKLKA